MLDNIRELSAFWTGEPIIQPKPGWKRKVLGIRPTIKQTLESLDGWTFENLTGGNNEIGTTLDRRENLGAVEETYRPGDIVVMGNGFLANYWETPKFHTSDIRVTPALNHQAVIFSPGAIYFDAEVTRQGNLAYWIGIVDRDHVHFFDKYADARP